MNQELFSRFSALKEKQNSVNSYKKILNQQITRLTSEEQSLKYKVDLYQKSSEVFKTWLDLALEDGTKPVSNLITLGLKHVMHDQDLTFKIEHEQKFNKIHMSFVLEEPLGKDTVEGDPLYSFGGTAAAIISFVLRITIMNKLGMNKLLLLDESMSSVSNFYVPGMGSFMRQLSEQTGINILMVTHNEEFISNAHTSYEGYKEKSLKLRRVNT